MLLTPFFKHISTVSEIMLQILLILLHALFKYERQLQWKSGKESLLKHFQPRFVH